MRRRVDFQLAIYERYIDSVVRFVATNVNVVMESVCRLFAAGDGGSRTGRMMLVECSIDRSVFAVHPQ